MYDVVVKKVHICCLISWWVSCDTSLECQPTVEQYLPPTPLCHVTLHNSALFDLYFAHSHPLYSSRLWRQRQRRGGRALWVASTSCHSYARIMSSQQRCADFKNLICVSPRSVTKDPHPQIIAICNLESAVRPHLNA